MFKIALEFKKLRMAKLINSIFASQKSKYVISPKGLDGFFLILPILELSDPLFSHAIEILNGHHKQGFSIGIGSDIDIGIRYYRYRYSIHFLGDYRYRRYRY